jgi:hypothetical protein
LSEQDKIKTKMNDHEQPETAEQRAEGIEKGVTAWRAVRVLAKV